MSKLPGKFVWFELVSRDPARAQAFYGEVLGWKVKQFPMGSETYDIIALGDAMLGGYAPPPPVGTPAHWISYVSVEDVEATIARAIAAGGSLVEAAFDVPTIGRMAKLADPQGAHFWVMRGEGDDEADVPATAGRFTWNELWTSDATAALAFYAKVFGYAHKDMDMGPAGTYHALERDGIPRGGLMRSPDAKVPPMWLPYVAVDDCDAVAARAARLGGKVHHEPSDIPGIGRFAVLADPTGATFAVLRPVSVSG